MRNNRTPAAGGCFYTRLLPGLLLTAVIFCITACGTTGTQSDAGKEAEHGTAGAVAMPVKDDYQPGPKWDMQERPTYENGPWAQTYALYTELARRAGEYQNVKPRREFTLAVHDPAESGPGQIMTAWANAVAVASDGSVRINVGYSGVFSSAMSSVDDMKQGTIDFVWTLPCYFKGYFPLTNVIQNPGLQIANGVSGSYAMWELYKSEPELRSEYEDDGIALFVCANCTSPLSYKGSAELDSIAEISGNIRGNNGPAQLFVQDVGANVFSCPIGEVYNDIKNGIINYLITDWNGIDSFALSDPGVLNYYLDTNIGCSAFALIANPDIWASIDEDLKGCILSASGDYMLNFMDIWNYWEAMGRYNAASNGGSIYAPSEAVAGQLSEVYADVAERWISAQEDSDVARSLYERAGELVEKYNAVYDWKSQIA